MSRRRGRGRRTATQGGISLSPSDPRDSSTTSITDRTPSASEVSSSELADGYFNHFEGFQEDPDASFAEAMSQLALHQGWSRAETREHRYEAVETEIDRYLGTNMDDLETWQKMCKACGLASDLPSITKCKKALATVHVNIYDFVEHLRHPDRVSVRIFPSLNQLRKYSVPHFLYPLGRAKADKFIKVLLRPFFSHRRK